jgi:DNA (cytosine-5)-methyltransferase 1
MENVPDAPIAHVPGNQVHAQLLNNRWYGGVQNRARRISFGTRDGRRLDVPGDIFEQMEWQPAVCASGGIKPGIDTAGHSARLKHMGWKTRAAFEQIRKLQGLDEDFELPNFTVGGAIKAVGNGVPLPLGRAIADAVKSAIGVKAS